MFEVTDTVQEIAREIGSRIAALRLARRMTQAELALRSGVSKHTVERIESGEGNPGLCGFIRVCQVIGELKGFNALLPKVELSPSEVFAGKSLPKRARKLSTRAVKWGDEE